LLGDITPGIVEHRLNSVVRERDLSPCSRNHLLTQLSGFFKYAVQRGWVGRHPIRGRIPRARVDNARTRWLRPHEIEAIKRHSPSWLKDIIDFAVRSGMRLGEITSLRVRHYQIDSNGRAFLRTALGAWG
jgi:integrase